MTGARARLAVAARVAFLGLVLYVALDFANPLMPGAVCFDPADSVEGVGRARASVAAPSIAVSPTTEVVLPAALGARVAASTATPRARTAVPIAPRARTAPAPDPSPAPDDH